MHTVAVSYCLYITVEADGLMLPLGMGSIATTNGRAIGLVNGGMVRYIYFVMASLK